MQEALWKTRSFTVSSDNKLIMTRKEKIQLLRDAVDLAGDGGFDPFTREERIIMYDFLNELEDEQA